ncbi:hypothetical protein M2152_002227 [Microbacteriaceae bacterium SG_E_30_P1]|uniref:Stress-response A/B barrel domain-containing protein n=1 Tax=Antiquaquibacter oligotrophicus TaxID=2880260 RepID=A0ABT6KPY3_9MICO|nr:Dabb family protein [Antiquaquibacter oligotrophicus]MDH6182045.1 hypothetical protein [Antiquaquibacter oligotrophicus]UDF12287.1 Dabb family protein [Antiquaquibacter oligotrophicus]
MIKHIVVWKLAATDDSAKAEATEEIRAVLTPLVDVIEGLRTLTVHANEAYFDMNWDVVLLSEFDSFEALAEYQVHPQHVAAAAVVHSHTTQRAGVDIEV